MSVKHEILAALHQQSLHGYELGRKLALIFKSGWDVKPGQIASTLTRLEEAGLVSHVARKSDAAPDRKEYQLTPAGQAELANWYLTPEVTNYRLGHAFYHKLVLSLLDAPVSTEMVLDAQRRELYQEMRNVLDIRQRTDIQSDLPLLLLIEAAIAHLEADLNWIERLQQSLPDLKQYQPPQPKPARRGRPPREA